MRLRRRFQARRKWTAEPKANAHKVLRRFLKGTAIHYVGPKVPPKVLAGDKEAVATYLEGIRRYHTGVKRWSDTAYNLAVDSKGRIWDLRGIKHLSGANGDEDVNLRYLAVVALIGEHQKPSPEMVKGLRKACRRIRRRYPFRAKEVVCHSDIRPGGTACPGWRLRRHVRAGDIDPLGLRRLLRAVRARRAKKG
jgi:hypothetical protein